MRPEPVADRLQVYVEACARSTCQHDRSSHFPEPKGDRGACLCRGCDCPAFLESKRGASKR